MLKAAMLPPASTSAVSAALRRRASASSSMPQLSAPPPAPAPPPPPPPLLAVAAAARRLLLAPRGTTGIEPPAATPDELVGAPVPALATLVPAAELDLLGGGCCVCCCWHCVCPRDRLAGTSASDGGRLVPLLLPSVAAPPLLLPEALPARMTVMDGGARLAAACASTSAAVPRLLV